MIIPKIKKSVKAFLLNEDGKISKKSLIKMGIILAGATFFSVPKVNSLMCKCIDSDHHCNINCEDDDIFGKLEGEYVIKDSDTHINAYPPVEHASGGLQDDVCHTRFDASHSSHDNSGGRETQTICITEHCNQSTHQNDIMLNVGEEGKSIQAQHAHNLNVHDGIMNAYSECGEKHCSND